MNSERGLLRGVFKVNYDPKYEHLNLNLRTFHLLKLRTIFKLIIKTE